MDIALKIEDDPNEKALKDLRDWLRRDSYIRDGAVPTRRAPSGQSLDAPTIELILTAGFKLADLALQLATWLRKSRAAEGKKLTITVNGWATVITKEHLRDSRNNRLLRALAGAPDPERSSVLLIAVNEYHSLRNLPTVENSVHRLRDALLDPRILGVSQDRLQTIENPQSVEDIEEAINRAAEQAKDALLVYFAGHGLKDAQGDLLLALPDADEDGEHDTVPWKDLARIIGGASSRRKIVWLDCCYAGAAIAGGPTLPHDSSAQGADTYLLAASHAEASSPEGEECTAFTGELVKVLQRGIEPGRPTELFLSPDKILKEIRIGLRPKGHPEPSGSDPGYIGSLPLFLNRLVARPVATDEVEQGSRQSSIRQVVRRNPRKIIGAAAAVVVVALAAIIGAAAPGSVASGLDLTRYCSTLVPGGSTSFVIAGQDCVRPVNLDDACIYSYATYGLKAVFASPDPNSAECVGPGASSATFGGISNMSGYCATSSRVRGVTATAKNPAYKDKWMCQLEINLDLACNAQNNTLALSAREQDDGSLECYWTHWYRTDS